MLQVAGGSPVKELSRGYLETVLAIGEEIRDPGYEFSTDV